MQKISAHTAWIQTCVSLQSQESANGERAAAAAAAAAPSLLTHARLGIQQAGIDGLAYRAHQLHSRVDFQGRQGPHQVDFFLKRKHRQGLEDVFPKGLHESEAPRRVLHVCHAQKCVGHAARGPLCNRLARGLEEAIEVGLRTKQGSVRVKARLSSAFLKPGMSHFAIRQEPGG